MAHLSLVPDLPAQVLATAPTQRKTVQAKPTRNLKKKSDPYNYTPARHRWLTDLAKGLVTAYECHVTDLSDDWEGIIAYPREDIVGRKAQNWICVVREWWQLSRNGHPRYRVLKLTESGSRTLNDWDQKHGEQ